MDWETKADIQQLRQDQRKREMIARFATPQGTTHDFAREVVNRFIDRLHGFGLEAHETTFNAPFDLWVGNCRIEVKGSSFRGRRYQANMRSNKADVLAFAAVNGSYHWYIIPWAEIGQRRTIDITSYYVSQYRGQWARYLEAWDVLLEAIKSAPPRPKQLALWGKPGAFPDPISGNLVPTEGSKYE